MLSVKVLKNATDWEEEADVMEKLEKSGVIVAPGKRCDIDGEIGWVRILFAVPMDTMREAIKRIGNVLSNETVAGGEPSQLSAWDENDQLIGS